VLREVANAVQAISGAAQATGASQAHPYETAGELAAALDDFDVRHYLFNGRGLSFV